jgi:two-component sensor histidine kinase
MFAALLSFAFDAVRLQNIDTIWIPINLCAIVIVLIFAVPAVLAKQKRNLNGKNQPFFNIAVLGLSFGFKNLLMIYVAGWFGVSDEANPYVRFIGGIFLGTAILIIFTNIVGSRLMREASLAELRVNESKLRAYRDAVINQLEEDSRLAATKTFDALSPQLEDLVRRAKQSQDILALVNKLISFIKNELKPFSVTLSREATNLSLRADVPSVSGDAEPEVRINASKLIRIWLSLIPVPFLFFLVSSFAVPSTNGLDLITASIVFLVSLSVFKLMAKMIPDVSTTQAFVLVTVVSLLATLPSFYLYSQVPNQDGIPELLPVFYIIPAMSIIAASQAYILDQRFSHTEDLLKVVVQELARENKIYQQKAWLASHGWYLLLHGMVQPALTAASIRASEAKGTEGEVNSLILSDLQRALDSLRDPSTNRRNLDTSLSEIQSAWEDICTIKYNIGEDVTNRVLQDEISQQVINEVLKEVVSNAVRHGNASNVEILMSLELNSSIRILATNDGTKPTDDGSESVGSRMLEAFCLDRSLIWNSETNRTEFQALIPIKT